MSAQRENSQGPPFSNPVTSALQNMKLVVFIPASVAVIGLIGFAVVFSATAQGAFTQLNDAITSTLGWNPLRPLLGLQAEKRRELLWQWRIGG